MARFLGLTAIVALVLFATPLNAQEAVQDTSALGRQAEGIPTDVGGAQPQAPSDDPTLTERQGIEGEQPAGEVAAPDAQMADEGTDDQLGDAGETEGAEMPVTASALPFVAALGVGLIALGIGLRLTGRRS